MKKKLLVLSIISAVLAVVGLVLAFVAFKTGGADFGTRIIGTFKGLFAFQTMIGAKDWLSLGISAVILILSILLIVFWIIHLIKLIVKKAPQWIAVDVLGLVGGLFGCYAMAAELVHGGFVQYTFPDLDTTAYNLLDAMFTKYTDARGTFWYTVFINPQAIDAVFGLLAVAFGLAAWIIGFKSIVSSLRVMEGKVSENGEKAAQNGEELSAASEKDGEGAPTSEDELRGAEDAELADDGEGSKVGP